MGDRWEAGGGGMMRVRGGHDGFCVFVLDQLSE